MKNQKDITVTRDSREYEEILKDAREKNLNRIGFDLAALKMGNTRAGIPEKERSLYGVYVIEK